MTDFAASFSGSASQTVGQTFDFGNAFGGDFIVGRASKSVVPTWAIVAGIGAALVVAVVWLVRR